MATRSKRKEQAAARFIIHKVTDMFNRLHCDINESRIEQAKALLRSVLASMDNDRVTFAECYLNDLVDEFKP